jgi:biofilm PGA synthesis N-glycosyltransferase PgaC
MPFSAAPIFLQILFWLFVAATVVQLAAWCFVFGKLASLKIPITNHQSPITSNQSPVTSNQITNQPTSVILCARNEAENLRCHLPAILAQQVDNEWELIVVDDASDDETPSVLHAFQENSPIRMRVIRIGEKVFPGKKYALAQGIAAAKHDLILLTDADCRPASPNWIAHMVAGFSMHPETEFVLGYGPMTSARNWWGAWVRHETAFTAAQYFSFALVGMPYMGVGRNLAFRRQVYDRVGGFATHAQFISGDDDLLVNAAASAKNTAICLDNESFMYSEAPRSFAVWLRQKQRHLSASPAYKWPHKLVLAMLAGSHFGHYFLFLVLMVTGFAPPIVLAIFLCRLLLVWIVLGKILCVLREQDLLLKVPMLDALLAGYFGVLVPLFLLIKKTEPGWGIRRQAPQT